MSKGKPEESVENKRKRLIYRSWHRGTREMDLLLGSFADRNVPEFSEEEFSQYDEILTYSDPDLYNWISGREKVPSNLINIVLEKLLLHKINK
jgi:antitoxin CptB